MEPTQLADAFLEQANISRKLGSPLASSLLQFAAQDVASAGACWTFLEPFAADPSGFVLPLRFLALFHRLALEGSLPELSRCYPSCGGVADAERAWHAIRRALEKQGATLHERLPGSVQTNEVGRCCALAPGFATVAASTGLPLRLLELGCSAGLNLRWDRYAYETSEGLWGNRQSRLIFRGRFANEFRFPQVDVRVTERRGCDLHPIPLDAEGRLRLLSFIWPDQMERFQLLSNALEEAAQCPAGIDTADAAEWTRLQLSKQSTGVATVLFHSIVWPYLTEDGQRNLQSLIADAGSRATADSPFAWLKMEPARDKSAAEVSLRIWPPGRIVLAARSGFHGQDVEILPAAPADA